MMELFYQITTFSGQQKAFHPFFIIYEERSKSSHNHPSLLGVKEDKPKFFEMDD